MIDLSTCKFVIWGHKDVSNTWSHIHEGFYRALTLTGKSVLWLDPTKDDVSDIDFKNAFFISTHDVVRQIPVRPDCFYAVFQGSGGFESLFANNLLMWGCYADNGRVDVPKRQEKPILFAPDEPYYPKERYLEFRWATDLLPHEIEANKPKKVFRNDSKVINWVGTVWHVNSAELASFQHACRENQIDFRHVGAGSTGAVSIEENIRLVQESYMAPAISGNMHVTEGYVPCRVFKNISYGQMVATNNPASNRLFGDRLIFNPNPYQLFYEARERLAKTTLAELYSLMDEVAKKHTYLNRINSILKATELILGKE